LSDPIIAIVGSVNAQRTDYNPPLRNVQVVKLACEELGRALAKSGYRIIVYSSDPAYIEADIVRGYIASNDAKPKSIQIRFPQSIGPGNSPSFPEQTTNPGLFDARPDAYPNWQVSFYMSLKDASGALLMGGSAATLITGVMAQSYRIPLICIATFGGSAQNVWGHLLGNLITEDERRLMGSDTWNSDTAEKLVKALGDQRQRLLTEELKMRQAQQIEQKAARNRAWLAGAFGVAAVALMIFGISQKNSDTRLLGVFFFGTPMVAGAWGGVARNLFDYMNGQTKESPYGTLMSAVLGMSAGLISALLFVLAQVAALKQSWAQVEGTSMLIPFELIIGFIAGYTLDMVFRKFQGTDVVNTGLVTVKSP
jgi:hypothetical protein